MIRSLKNKLLVLLSLVGLMAVVGCAPSDTSRVQQDGVITTGSLYEEMIDLEGLTRFPEPSYETVP